MPAIDIHWSRYVSLSIDLIKFNLLIVASGAHLSVFPEKYTLPVFNTLPPGMFWPGLISSILAAIVASQAMITGTFQIISQATSLCYLPRIRIKFTSTVVHGQVR
jgi:KUP system potassium uptake protein